MRRLLRRTNAASAAVSVRRRAGGGIIWFMLVMLPIASFGAAMAVDFSRIVMHGRQVSSVAEAAALAGAQQVVPGTAKLDVLAARSEARALVDLANSKRVARVVVLDRSVKVVNTPEPRVSVTVDYRVDGLTFVPLVQSVLGGAIEKSQTYSLTRSATVCVPGATVKTSGYCARPRF